MGKKTAKSDIIAIRDSILRSRIQALVESAKGKITIADIVRAAIEEKLDQVDRTGSFTIDLPGLAEPAPAAYGVRAPSAGALVQPRATYTRQRRTKASVKVARV